MDPFLLALGIVIGIIAVAPLGPVNIIVIRCSLQRGLRSGLLAGSGSVAGDGIFAAIAAYGVRWIEDLVQSHATLLQVVCGLLLVIMGLRTARRRRMVAARIDEPLGVARAALTFLTTFSLTIFNPATLMGFIALFASTSDLLRLGSAPYRPGIAVVGVMLGSYAWWLFLSSISVSFRARLSIGHLLRLNMWAGLFVAGCGFLLLLNAAL